VVEDEVLSKTEKRAPKQFATYRELPSSPSLARNYDNAAIKALAEKGMVEITKKQGYKPQLPQDHAIQVHASMAMLGIRQWWFVSYHVDPATEQRVWEPLVCRVVWDWFTDQVEASLQDLAVQYADLTARLSAQCPLK